MWSADGWVGAGNSPIEALKDLENSSSFKILSWGFVKSVRKKYFRTAFYSHVMS